MDASVAPTNEAVNSQASMESAPVDNQQNVQSPPLEGHASEHNQAEQRIPYDRFKSVIDERNQERIMREAAEARLRELQSPQLDPTHSQIQAAIENYKAAGLTEQAAKVLVENQLKLVQSQQAELKSELHTYKVNEWTRELKDSYKDYAEVSVEADKQFNSLSPSEKNEVMSSRRALHNFFKAVRADVLEQKVNKSFNEGANHAYQNKQMKQGMGNVPGKAPAPTPGAGLTREAIRSMDPETYRKRLPEINEALMKGLIK